MDLSIVVPTRNEEANVDELVARSALALAGLDLEWEMLFVDDSDDATPQRVHDASRSGHPVRLLHRARGARVGGLGGAVAEGFRLVADSSLLAVMDGDLQHRPEVLGALVEAVRNGADLAIASRDLSLSPARGSFERCWRSSVSRISRAVVHALVPRSAMVSDPLAGYFVLRRSVIENVELRPEGFKILLEILARGSWSAVGEVRCNLDRRLHGHSKANLEQGLAFARHLARLIRSAPGDRRRREGVVHGLDRSQPFKPTGSTHPVPGTSR